MASHDQLLLAASGGQELRRWHNAVKMVQHSLAKYEGELVSVINDDCECIITAAFGLNPHSHRDDAVRASLCALDVCADLYGSGLKAGSPGRPYFFAAAVALAAEALHRTLQAKTIAGLGEAPKRA